LMNGNDFDEQPSSSSFLGKGSYKRATKLRRDRPAIRQRPTQASFRAKGC
jgi:hypothetical protein